MALVTVLRTVLGDLRTTALDIAEVLGIVLGLDLTPKPILAEEQEAEVMILLILPTAVLGAVTLGHLEIVAATRQFTVAPIPAQVKRRLTQDWRTVSAGTQKKPVV